MHIKEKGTEKALKSHAITLISTTENREGGRTVGSDRGATIIQ